MNSICYCYKLLIYCLIYAIIRVFHLKQKCIVIVLFSNCNCIFINHTTKRVVFTYEACLHENINKDRIM